MQSLLQSDKRPFIRNPLLTDCCQFCRVVSVAVRKQLIFLFTFEMQAVSDGTLEILNHSLYGFLMHCSRIFQISICLMHRKCDFVPRCHRQIHKTSKSFTIRSRCLVTLVSRLNKRALFLMRICRDNHYIRFFHLESLQNPPRVGFLMQKDRTVRARSIFIPKNRFASLCVISNFVLRPSRSLPISVWYCAKMSPVSMKIARISITLLS